jgi:hypothetical protein
MLSEKLRYPLVALKPELAPSRRIKKFMSDTNSRFDANGVADGREIPSDQIDSVGQ